MQWQHLVSLNGAAVVVVAAAAATTIIMKLNLSLLQSAKLKTSPGPAGISMALIFNYNPVCECGGRIK